MKWFAPLVALAVSFYSVRAIADVPDAGIQEFVEAETAPSDATDAGTPDAGTTAEDEGLIHEVALAAACKREPLKPAEIPRKEDCMPSGEEFGHGWYLTDEGMVSLNNYVVSLKNERKTCEMDLLQSLDLNSQATVKRDDDEKVGWVRPLMIGLAVGFVIGAGGTIYGITQINKLK